MNQKFYTKNGEWAMITDSVVVCGLSSWAAGELGEVTFVELPALQTSVFSSKPALTVEAVKAATDYYSPVTGTVIEVNSLLSKEPALLNTDPEGSGWLYKVHLVELHIDELLSEQDFLKWVKNADE